jgi:molybdenum cofactor sulfurtransferase
MPGLILDLREKEFSRLDATGHVYLDYTGSGLYPESLIHRYTQWLTSEVYGNPHSLSPASMKSTHYVENARTSTLNFFDARPDEYAVIFTLNASGALKLVGESYPFQQGSYFALTADNHNSVNGVREFARAKGGTVQYLPLNDQLRARQFSLPVADRSKHNLFAYPAQSNFSGVKHPMDWIEHAHNEGYDVLLDAAAYVATNELSLREVKPDFLAVSFYKMFGFPTGVGALIASHDALDKLHRPWFGGGTVRFVSTQNRVHLLKKTSEAFEDGTLNFLNIPAVSMGLDFLSRVGMKNINEHVTRLTKLLLDQLQALRHANGTPLVRLYGPATTKSRGATIAFNLLNSDGEETDYRLVEERAIRDRIMIRTGCFCNPGAAEAAFQYSAVRAYQCFERLSPGDFSLQQFSSCMNDKPVGAVRASLGIASNDADVHEFIELLREFTDHKGEQKPRMMPDVIGG